MEKIKGLFAKINNLYTGHKFLLVITYISIFFAISYDIWLFHFMLSTYRRLCDIILLLPYGFIPAIFLIAYFILHKFVPEISKILYLINNTIWFLFISLIFYYWFKPLVVIPIIYLVLYFVLHKFAPKAAKYANTTISIILFMIIIFLFFSLLELIIERDVCDYLPFNPQKYQVVMEHLFDKDKDNIQLFFPKEIPNDAENIEFNQLYYVLMDDYNDGFVQLKFKTSPKYIEEIKNKNYKKEDISNKIKSDIEYLKNRNKDLKSNNILYQVIDENICIDNDHDGYIIGYISINNESNLVLYRYLLHKNKISSNICKGKKMYYMK